MLINLNRGGVLSLSEVCQYVAERIPYSSIEEASYVSTDNLLQDCAGVKPYEGEPNVASVVTFHKDDILLSNIRPYLRKLWLADRDGGCNADVLVLRVTTDSYLPAFVYQLLRRQQFFDYVMQDVKGMKMPRGNKDHIMRYALPKVSLSEQQKVMSEIAEYEQAIGKAQQVMDGCAQRKREVLNRYLG